MNKVLEVKNITKIYKVYQSNIDRLKEIFFKKSYHKQFVSNKDITFDLYEGETLGIIGINGAGKSTLLKIIAGVINSSSGEVLRHGRVTALLELGTGFNHELKGYDNIYLNGTLIGMSKNEIDEKLDDIINFSELGEYIYEPIKTYSSGMSMRLAFSIAIFSEPNILIVDEALSVGDAHFAAKCTKALRERKEKNMSIIYVSHDLNSLKILCDRVLLLHKGGIIESGTPEYVLNRYNFLIAKINDDKDIMKIDSQRNHSFGTYDVKIKNVFIKKNNEHFYDFETGNVVDIEIEFESKIDLADLTVGIIIRDKFGQDMYGTNTHYQKQTIKIEKEKTYLCIYQLALNIGSGKYSLGVALHRDEFHLDQCYHWLDNAYSFTVSSGSENIFVGLCKLEPSISFNECIKNL